MYMVYYEIKWLQRETIVLFLASKIAILVPQHCFEGQFHPSTFKTVNLVFVDAVLHGCTRLMLKSPFYPCLFVPSLQFPPALSQTEFVSHS
jgi:hypothetical protein